jgi:hypothetical protein
MSGASQNPAAMIEHQQNEQPQIERQQMSVDIACVGFGPAMGGFLTTLSRSLLNDDGSVRLESATSPGMPLQVICYERADGVGLRSLRCGHQGARNTRQLPRRGPYRDSDGGSR